MINKLYEQKKPYRHEFKINPNLINREIIIKGSKIRGCKFIGNIGYNDIFDIYYPINYKNKVFLMIKSQDFNLDIDIIDLDNYEIINQLGGGHKINKNISMIRHFAHLERKKDFLLSSTYYEVVLWDLNLFNIIFIIKSEFSQLSYSSILLFNDYNKLSPDLIIISYSEKRDIKKDFIKIYNFSSGEFIKNLLDLDSITCFYLLSWNKFENNDYKNTYIIACSTSHIIIYFLVYSMIFIIPIIKR